MAAAAAVVLFVPKCLEAESVAKRLAPAFLMSRQSSRLPLVSGVIRMAAIAHMQAYGAGGQRALSLGRLANLARLYW